MNYPDWVIKHKEKGTTIRKIGNRYYKYKVHSKRVPDKKYPVLIQDELLGIITEDGFIESKKKLIDISNIELVNILDIPNYIFIEEYDYHEIQELKKTYLLKIGNKLYYPKLTDVQYKTLIKHKVEVNYGVAISNF